MIPDENDRLVSLYWKRDEQAIRETEDKYGPYLFRIADNILGNEEDSREVINDTYFKAWCSIPPHRPENLSAFLAKITREGAIDLYRSRKQKKRKDSEYQMSLDELDECLPSGSRTEEAVEAEMLIRSIEAYLKTLTEQKRVIFICRYFYEDSLKDIAGYQGISVSKVKTMLFRVRKGLKEYLEKEGYML